MPATEQGREYALEQLQIRREKNKTRKRINNSALPAGAPMYYDCLGCGGVISVPEAWISKPDLCPECSALKKLGWLE